MNNFKHLSPGLTESTPRKCLLMAVPTGYFLCLLLVWVKDKWLKVTQKNIHVYLESWRPPHRYVPCFVQVALLLGFSTTEVVRAKSARPPRDPLRPRLWEIIQVGKKTLKILNVNNCERDPNPTVKFKAENRRPSFVPRRSPDLLIKEPTPGSGFVRNFYV